MPKKFLPKLLVSFAGFCSLLAVPVFVWGLGEDPTPLTEASFTLSSDPTDAILSIRSTGGLRGTVSEMNLYGDGRLVLSREQHGNFLGEWVRELNFEEMRRLVRIATDHGLAEWRPEKQEIRQRELAGGQPLPRLIDGSRVEVRLALKSYERGTIRLEPVISHISFNTPSFLVQKFPGYQELQGVRQLSKEMYDWIREINSGEKP